MTLKGGRCYERLWKEEGRKGRKIIKEENENEKEIYQGRKMKRRKYIKEENEEEKEEIY